MGQQPWIGIQTIGHDAECDVGGWDEPMERVNDIDDEQDTEPKCSRTLNTTMSSTPSPNAKQDGGFKRGTEQ